MSCFGRVRRSVRPWITVVASAGLFVGAVCLGDDFQNRQLLETLPRDRRAMLAETLDRFDRLSGAEQNAIRRLDKKIVDLEDLDKRARYRVLLQQYHLWFQGLPEDQQANLLAFTDLEDRFRAARKLRLAEAAGPKRDGPRLAKIRTGEYGLLGPFEAGFLLRVWRELSPDKQAEVAKNSPLKLREALRVQARELKMKPDPFPAEQEKIYLEKLEKDDDFRPLTRRLDSNQPRSEAQKKAETAQRKFEHPFAELLYFEENRPKPVDPVRLSRFGELCPDWFHAMTDSLAPDDARDYYTIVYRRHYPSPAEIPEPTKAVKGTNETAPKKSSTPKAGSSPSAF